jgi:hypothetical protein
MQIIIVDTREAIIRQLRQTLGTFVQHLRPDRVSVEIHHGNVQDWDAEGVCFINPGNCAGIMTGALDRVLVSLMPGVHADVQAMMQAHGDVDTDGSRYLPMFSALLSRSDNGRWLLTAPCMWSPGVVSYRGTRHAFHSTHLALSMLICANRAGMNIRRVIMPGMCTGHGRLNRADAAHQMSDAFRAVFIDGNIVSDGTQTLHPRLLISRHYYSRPKP